jgi:dihydroxyacetone kinase-like predicted kinase
VAVVAGEGNKELFRTLGVHAVVDGGQSMNPSAAQLLEAIDSLGAEQVVVLPNNGNVILTAEQAAGMSSRHVAVVPASSIPAGLAAMVAFDAAADAADNARSMEAAVRDVHSAEITHAVRDSEVDGVVVTQGQVIGLVDGRVVAASDDLLAVFKAVVDEFASRQPEIVTVLTALNGSQVSVAELEASARAACPDAEIEFHVGGQPLYPILASAE